jgi:hypothetical protein
MCMNINSASLVVPRRIAIAEYSQKRAETARSFRRPHGDATRWHSLVEPPPVNHVDGRLVSLRVAQRRTASGFCPGRSQPTAGWSRIGGRIHHHTMHPTGNEFLKPPCASIAPYAKARLPGFKALVGGMRLGSCLTPLAPGQHGPYCPHPFPARSLAMCCLTRYAT